MTCLVVSLSGGCNMMESNWGRVGAFVASSRILVLKMLLFQPETELIYPQKEWFFLPNKIWCSTRIYPNKKGVRSLFLSWNPWNKHCGCPTKIIGCVQCFPQPHLSNVICFPTKTWVWWICHFQQRDLGVPGMVLNVLCLFFHNKAVFCGLFPKGCLFCFPGMMISGERLPIYNNGLHGP